jgi:hypothetical protein
VRSHEGIAKSHLREIPGKVDRVVKPLFLWSPQGLL